MPQKTRRFTEYHRFPHSISVKSIVAVMSQIKDATKKFAIATTKRSLATNFGSAFCPPLSRDDAMYTALSWSQVDASLASCRNQQKSNGSTSCHDIHQFLLLVAIWVWSSFANLSISKILCSERPNSIMVFLNHRSRINRSWMFLYLFFRHFFWSLFAVWYSLSTFFPYLWPCGQLFLM